MNVIADVTNRQAVEPAKHAGLTSTDLNNHNTRRQGARNERAATEAAANKACFHRGTPSVEPGADREATEWKGPYALFVNEKIKKFHT